MEPVAPGKQFRGTESHTSLSVETKWATNQNHLLSSPLLEVRYVQGFQTPWDGGRRQKSPAACRVCRVQSHTATHSPNVGIKNGTAMRLLEQHLSSPSSGCQICPSAFSSHVKRIKLMIRNRLPLKEEGAIKTIINC